jgi:hypothetical protein
METRNIAGAIDAVYFEEVRRHLGVDAAHAYGGFLGGLMAWCEEHSIPYEGVSVGIIKKFITGKGNAGKTAVINAVKAFGYNPEDDNEADALALLHYATQQHEIGRSHETLSDYYSVRSPLWRRVDKITAMPHRCSVRLRGCWSVTLGVEVTAE